MNEKKNPENTGDGQASLEDRYVKFRGKFIELIVMVFGFTLLGAATLFSFLLPGRFLSYLMISLDVAIFSFFFGVFFGIRELTLRHDFYFGATDNLATSARVNGQWSNYLAAVVKKILVKIIE